MTSPRGGKREPQGALWIAELMWELGCVQFGDFSVGRTARNSPVYLNPKLLVSRPEALARVAALIEAEVQMKMALRNQQVAPFDLIAGVPIGGLHIATALALQMRVPLIYARTDPLALLGEQTHIEGIYRPGQTAIIVDDLTTGGGSLIDTAEALRHQGLYVRDALVLVNREQGAARRLQEAGMRLHPILTLEVLLTYLHELGYVPDQDYHRAIAYLTREGEPRSEFD
jgi:orotate phosphoribosyltransferase/uridine monophosphate synthetase